VKTATPAAARPKLAELRALGRPVELADDEWATFDNALTAAENALNQGDAKKRPARPLPMMARADFNDAVAAAEAAAKIIDQRQRDYNAAITPALLGVLKPAAVNKLKSNKTPAAVCAEATRLIAEANAAGAQFDAIKDYGDVTVATDQRAAFDNAISDLDLIGAEDWLDKMKVSLKDAQDEKAEVGKLQALHTGPGAPTTVKDWRKLADHERRFVVVDAAMPKAISDAESSPLASKTAQVGSLKAPILSAITDWPAKPVPEKLSTHNTTVGSIVWLEERLDRLLEPTGDPAAAAAAREAREWAAMLQDIAVQWQAFVNSGFAASMRGPFAPKRVKTESVRAKCLTTSTFSAAGRTFTKASSDTSGVSYHTPLPPPYALNKAGQEIRSFIYHI
jgi:hypothetical protein